MHRRRRTIFVAVSVAVVLLAAGCNGTSDRFSGDDATSTTLAVSPEPSNVQLSGVKGTAPLTTLPDDLRDRLRRLAPTLGFNSGDAVRSYDAVIVAVLAAEFARTDAPARVASNILGVASGGKSCTTFADCRIMTDNLEDLHYTGASGALNLAVDGESTDTAYGAYQFNNEGTLTKLSNESTQVALDAPPMWDPDPTAGPSADGVLKIAMVLPTEGDPGKVGDAARAGVRAAIDEVNDNGGAVGRQVELINGDSKDGSAINTVAAVDSVLKDGADVVIGGTGPIDTTAMLGPVTSAGVVLIVPGTVASLDARITRSGFLFRMSPPDTVQGTVLANVVADDGITHVTLLVEGGGSDGGMADTFTAGFTSREGAITATVPFTSDESIPAVIDRATQQQTNGFVLLGDLQTDAKLLAELRARNLGPDTVATYVSNISPLLATANS